MSTLKIKNGSTWESISVIKGDTGATGQGVPAGGATGQVLAKASATDYDATWVNQNGGLPAVTSSDNGKVLRVVNGVWAAAQLPSASGVSF